MTLTVPPSSTDDLFLQRRLTRDGVKLWGFEDVRFGHGKILINRVTEETGRSVDPIAWATPGSPQARLSLLGQLTPSTIDLDLDVRLTAYPKLRPPDWSDVDKALAEEWFYRPFREEIKALTGDTRNHWGRASIGGTGHWLIRLANDDDLSVDDRKRRLKDLGFEASVGPFTIKLEVRVPIKKAAKLCAVLPGSQYDDGDYVAFYQPQEKRDPHLQEIGLRPLCQALYGAAMRMVASPLVQEGDRHHTALLVSGVLRHEIEDTEREGGTFNRDEARRLFEAIFSGDDEIKLRRKVFEDDLDKGDLTYLPHYNALGDRIGEATADAIARMLRGYDRRPVDAMRDQMVFISDDAASVINTLERSAGQRNLTLYSRQAIAELFPDTISWGKKHVRVFQIVKGMKSRRQVDGWLIAPGYPQSEILYLATDGQLVPQRRSPEDVSLINRGPGWATPYVDEEIPRRHETWATLQHMLGWFTDDKAHQAKIMQMIAFKVQNPLTKPQFALAVSGGQGIGKSTFFSEVLRTLLGGGVKTTSLDAVFSENYTFSSMLGAALLIIEEADEIPDFTLSKQLHREKQLDVNIKYSAKGLQWSFGIPVYLTNKAEPKLNEPGAIDRTLYVIRAPTQHSLGLSAEAWLAFQKQRTAETDAVREKLKDKDFLLALRQIFEEYPVTQVELQDTTTSDSRREDYRVHDLSPEQQALQAMLSRGYIHHERPNWAFDAPVTKEAFNEGFNELYLRFAEKHARPLTNEFIAKRVKEMLGAELGAQTVRQIFGKGRVYWFKAKLGTLRQTFADIQGVAPPGETEALAGANDPDVEACKRAWEEWAPKGRLTDRAGY
jgi:hypothetical protein